MPDFDPNQLIPSPEALISLIRAQGADLRATARIARGWLGILFGEQIIPVGKQMLAGSPLPVAMLELHVAYVREAPGRDADETKISTTIYRRNPHDQRNQTPDLILHNELFTTLDRSNPTSTAVAVKGGRLTAVGRSEDIMPLAGAETRVIDLKRRRVLPGADRGSQRLLGRPGM